MGDAACCVEDGIGDGAPCGGPIGEGAWGGGIGEDCDCGEGLAMPPLSPSIVVESKIQIFLSIYKKNN